MSKALHTACRLADEQAVRLLLQHGAPVDVADSTSGWRPLHRAVAENHSIIVNLLLEQKANVNACDRNMCRPLHLACEFGYLSLVKLLLSRGASSDCEDRMGVTPLKSAIRSGKVLCSFSSLYRISNSIQEYSLCMNSNSK